MSRNANGQGHIRKRSDGLWEGQYSTLDSNGKRIRHSVYGKTQKEATQKLNTKTNEINMGIYIPYDKMSLGEWCDIWLRDYLKDVKQSTVHQYEYQIRMHIKPALGRCKLQKVTPPMIQNFYNESMKEKKVTGKDGKIKQKKGLSPKSIKNLHGVMHKLFNQAVACRYIPMNPCTACKLPRVEKREMSTINDEKMSEFLNAIKGDKYENLYFVDVFTGMREAELIGLTWDCIDFENGLIYVEKQLRRDHALAGEQYAFTSLKNGKTRTVRPAHDVFDALQKERTKQRENRLKYGSSFSNEDNLVFTNEIGEHLSCVTVYNHIKRILASIGLEHVRFHDLRHTYATISLQNGDNIKTVSKNLGHATVAFTLDVYGHVTEEMEKESASNMHKYIKKMSV